MKKKLSFLAWLLIAVVCLVKVATLKKWKDESVIKWDVEEYYKYLPAAYIYHDLNFGYIDSVPGMDRQYYGLQRHPETGLAIGRMSFGMGLAYTPLFWVAHGVAKVSAYPPNGYSPPYQLAVLLTGVIFTLLGLWFLRLVLLRYFSEGITAITLLSIGLGTNLYYYTVVEGGMTHATLFGLLCMFLYYTIRWHESPKARYMYSIAFVLGFAALIRPTNITIGLVFLLYGLGSKEGFTQTLQNYRKHYAHFLIPLILIPLLILPQLVFWKLHTGHWVYYSYGEEGFFFSHPNFQDGLISYRKGWLLYTPMMILALAGFFLMRKYLPRLWLPVLIFSFLNMYIVFSWWCWWYGGGFGMRALIESYAFLALPLAALWQYVWNRKVLTAALGLVAFFFLYLNQYQTEQYQRVMLHWDSMSEELYWATFLNPDRVENFDALADPPDYAAAMKGEEE